MRMPRITSAGYNHFTNGGTGITNFNPKEYTRYLKAIKASGFSELYIVKAPYEFDQLGMTMYSLHRKHAKRSLDSFWRVYEKTLSAPSSVLTGT